MRVRFAFLAILILTVSPVESSAELKTFWHGTRQTREIALTFDDAPFEPHTSAILKILERYKVRAAFFIVGKHARLWPDTVKTIIDKGHEVGNHTEMHRPLAGLEKRVVKTEILSLQAYLQSRYGILPRFFRPPQGMISAEALLTIDEAGMDLVFWDVDPQDWAKPGMMNIARNIADHIRPGSIVLLHTLNPQTVETLPVLLEYLQKDGYRMALLSDLLDRSAYQPAPDTATRR